MVKHIWKYKISLQNEQQVKMHEGAEIISVLDNGTDVHVYAIADLDAPIVKRKIVMFSSGYPIAVSNLKYIGSLLKFDGVLSFHIFEQVVT